MSLKLYATIGSPAVRGTLLTIRALGIKDMVKIVDVNLPRLDNFKPEFIEKNPTHTVPVLEDGNFVLWDSHAINAYLVNKYAKNDALYPKDPQKQALVDSMNHFHNGYLFARGVRISRAVFNSDESADLEKLREEITEVFDMLEIILEKRSYVAGEELTIADLSMVATLSTIEIYSPLNKDNHPNILKWYRKMKQLPYYGVNQKGVEAFSTYFNSLLSKL